MAAPVVEIEGLGKRYRLSFLHRPDNLKSYLKSLVGAGPASGTRDDDQFWALQDVNLTIEEGECLALVGKNGSGKSTLLKILSRIVPPTTGTIRVRGKVVPLLEVGTGFHPELTGRENIFLNGAMLGCVEAEIARRFDSIVAFSGVERFLDMPVKHYSSGMYVRLAYAVAAHVDAKVFVIDEVLAVGDADFHAKCVEHIKSLPLRGSTTIFVSHNERLVRRLATHIATLEAGRCVSYRRNDARNGSTTGSAAG
jgi:ABC-type polysaccharide/polyol phosphate transport system ATPase subunit